MKTLSQLGCYVIKRKKQDDEDEVNKKMFLIEHFLKITMICLTHFIVAIFTNLIHLMVQSTFMWLSFLLPITFIDCLKNTITIKDLSQNHMDWLESAINFYHEPIRIINPNVPHSSEASKLYIYIVKMCQNYNFHFKFSKYFV